MAMQTSGDFVVDTGGHCFICMKEILSSQLSSDASQLGSFCQGSSSCSIRSLQQLSRYLKLKMSRVFNQESLIPKSLLSKVEMSTLKADLCDECAGWTSKLSDLYRKMEKIEIEAASYLQLIHDKLITKEAMERKTNNLLNKIAEISSTDGSLGKLEVTRSLRRETMQRCSQKLSTIHPKVKIKKLTEAKIQQKMSYRLERSSRLARPKQEIQSNFNYEDFSNSGAESIDLKWERNELDAVSDVSGNSYLDDLGTENEDSEREQEGNLSIKKDIGNGSFVNDTTIKVIKPPMYQKDPKTGNLKCSICLKTFKAISTLYLHNQKVHLKIRYKCELCDKIFTRTDNLKVHQKSVHFKQQFKCPICFKSFATYSNKHRHVKNKICGIRNSKQQNVLKSAK